MRGSAAAAIASLMGTNPERWTGTASLEPSEGEEEWSGR